MDIAFVSTWSPAQCGIATYTAALAAALRARGHRVTILAELTNTSALVREPGVYRCWDRRFGFDAPRGLGAIVNLIASSEKKPDVVHIQHEFGLFPRDGEFAALVKALAQTGGIVTTLHTVLPPPQHANFFASLRGMKIVHSQAAAAVMASLGNVAEYVPHGVASRENVMPAQTHVLCPGFITPGKGHEEIIEAFALAGPVPHSTKLIIAGLCRNPHYLDALQAKIAAYGVDVEVLNEYLDDTRRHELFSHASFAILGAGKTTPYSASGQMATAISYHMPVIAKAAPIYEGVPGALYYRTADECATWIKALLYSGTLRWSLRDAQAATAVARAWETVAAVHEDFYAHAV